MIDWEFNYAHFFTLEKILDVEDLSDFREKSRSKKIVFTNGFFDLLHPGHVFLLYEARLLGDILVVGVNSDISIQKEDTFDDWRLNKDKNGTDEDYEIPACRRKRWNLF